MFDIFLFSWYNMHYIEGDIMKNLKKYSKLYKVALKSFVFGYVASSLTITGVSAFNSMRVES